MNAQDVSNHPHEARTENESLDALHEALERAERAEAKLAKLEGSSKDAASSHVGADDTRLQEGVAELRKDSMMAHLLGAMAAGKDLGHYGRLVFTMVARFFLPAEEIVQRLAQDPEFSEAAALALVQQVDERDYNPPKRERILAWQKEQEFPILPDPEDPDCGNVYRNLRFPDSIYEHIEQYHEQKAASE